MRRAQDVSNKSKCNVPVVYLGFKINVKPGLPLFTQEYLESISKAYIDKKQGTASTSSSSADAVSAVSAVNASSSNDSGIFKALMPKLPNLGNKLSLAFRRNRCKNVTATSTPKKTPESSTKESSAAASSSSNATAVSSSSAAATAVSSSSAATAAVVSASSSSSPIETSVDDAVRSCEANLKVLEQDIIDQNEEGSEHIQLLTVEHSKLNLLLEKQKKERHFNETAMKRKEIKEKEEENLRVMNEFREQQKKEAAMDGAEILHSKELIKDMRSNNPNDPTLKVLGNFQGGFINNKANNDVRIIVFFLTFHQVNSRQCARTSVRSTMVSNVWRNE